MKKEFFIVQGDPDELSPYSKDNLIELECGETSESLPKDMLEREMAAILRDVIEVETGKKVKYPIKLVLSDNVALDRLIPRSEEELKELADEREVGCGGGRPDFDRSEADEVGAEPCACWEASDSAGDSIYG